MLVRSMLAVVVVVFAGVSGQAAQQLVSTKTLLVKNPPSGSRKVLWKVTETGSAATVAGDPTADGATLRIQLTTGGGQCVSMPASGWTTIGSIGFKYKDSSLANGPVKIAQIKKTPSGTFIVKALLKNGGPTSIAVVPGDPTTTYATNFTLGTGDQYCGGTASATPNPNDAKTFKVSNDGVAASCIASCSGPTSSTVTTTSSTTSTTILTVCGDGTIEGTEQCDDSNTTPGDGCDAICQIEETTSQFVPGGGTVSSGAAATAADPLETSVTTPNAGTVTIFETSPGSPPAGYEFRGQGAQITAPNASTSDNPLELIFLIDASQVRAGETEATVQVFRNGVLVPPCLGAPGSAVPEPCVGERTLLPGGDILLRVFATHTSPWSFGYPLCGNGVLDGSETCDPPAGGCGGGQSCKSDCTCAATCDCCAGSPTALTITHGLPGGTCGSVKTLTGADALAIPCNTVPFGGGGNLYGPLFDLPDGDFVLNVTACDATAERLTLGPTTSAQTGDLGSCTTAGCRFGAPITVPNAASTPTSLCLVQTVSQNASGVASCDGAISQLALPLEVEMFLTGDSSTDPAATIPGIQPCPLCSGGSCVGGPNNGMACTPGSSAFGPGYPTSNDCPPDPMYLISMTSAGLAFTTGTVHWTATPATNDTGSTASVQNRVFAGWCRDANGANQFENPAHQCWENGLAVGTPCAGTYESCEQYHNGAFGPSGGNNKTINQIGSAPGCLADELPHAAKLVGPMRFPPTFDSIVDQVTSMPGPGTMGLDGTMQLQ